jgi:putative hemolysin
MDVLKMEITQRPTLAVSLTKSASEIREAQQLRHRIFAEECGAQLSNHIAGTDEDEFDSLCDHLIVRDVRQDIVVGTYRILTSWKAKELGRFYSESEFDLTNLKPLAPRLVDGGTQASETYLSLRNTCMSPSHWRVVPHRPYPIGTSHLVGKPILPPLVKGYVRLGSFICGEPGWDKQFNTADLLMLLPLSRMDSRYARHFLGAQCRSHAPAA